MREMLCIPLTKSVRDDLSQTIKYKPSGHRDHFVIENQTKVAKNIGELISLVFELLRLESTDDLILDCNSTKCVIGRAAARSRSTKEFFPFSKIKNERLDSDDGSPESVDLGSKTTELWSTAESDNTVEDTEELDVEMTYNEDYELLEFSTNPNTDNLDLDTIINSDGSEDDFHGFTEKSLISQTKKNLIERVLSDVDIVTNESSTSTSPVDSFKALEKGNHFFVEGIHGRRKHKGEIEYLLKWEGYSHAFDTWEPVDNLKCPGLIAEYEETREENHDPSVLIHEKEEIVPKKRYGFRTTTNDSTLATMSAYGMKKRGKKSLRKDLLKKRANYSSELHFDKSVNVTRVKKNNCRGRHKLMSQNIIFKNNSDLSMLTRRKRLQLKNGFASFSSNISDEICSKKRKITTESTNAYVSSTRFTENSKTCKKQRYSYKNDRNSESDVNFTGKTFKKRRSSLKNDRNSETDVDFTGKIKVGDCPKTKQNKNQNLVRKCSRGRVRKFSPEEIGIEIALAKAAAVITNSLSERPLDNEFEYNPPTCPIKLEDSNLNSMRRALTTESMYEEAPCLMCGIYWNSKMKNFWHKLDEITEFGISILEAAMITGFPIASVNKNKEEQLSCNICFKRTVKSLKSKIEEKVGNIDLNKIKIKVIENTNETECKLRKRTSSSLYASDGPSKAPDSEIEADSSCDSDYTTMSSNECEIDRNIITNYTKLKTDVNDVINKTKISIATDGVGENEEKTVTPNHRQQAVEYLKKFESRMIYSSYFKRVYQDMLLNLALNKLNVLRSGGKLIRLKKGEVQLTNLKTHLNDACLDPKSSFYVHNSGDVYIKKDGQKILLCNTSRLDLHHRNNYSSVSLNLPKLEKNQMSCSKEEPASASYRSEIIDKNNSVDTSGRIDTPASVSFVAEPADKNISKDTSVQKIDTPVSVSDGALLTDKNISKPTSENADTPSSVSYGVLLADKNIPMDTSENTDTPASVSYGALLTDNIPKDTSENTDTSASVSDGVLLTDNIPMDASENMDTPASVSYGAVLTDNIPMDASENMDTPASVSYGAEFTDKNITKDTSVRIDTQASVSYGELLADNVSKDTSENADTPSSVSYGVLLADKNIPKDTSENADTPASVSYGALITDSISKDTSENTDTPSSVSYGAELTDNIPMDISENTDAPASVSYGALITDNISKDTSENMDTPSVSYGALLTDNIPMDASENSDTPASVSYGALLTDVISMDTAESKDSHLNRDEEFLNIRDTLQQSSSMAMSGDLEKDEISSTRKDSASVPYGIEIKDKYKSIARVVSSDTVLDGEKLIYKNETLPSRNLIAMSDDVEKDEISLTREEPISVSRESELMDTNTSKEISVSSDNELEREEEPFNRNEILQSNQNLENFSGDSDQNNCETLQPDQHAEQPSGDSDKNICETLQPDQHPERPSGDSGKNICETLQPEQHSGDSGKNICVTLQPDEHPEQPSGVSDKNICATLQPDQHPELPSGDVHNNICLFSPEFNSSSNDSFTSTSADIGKLLRDLDDHITDHTSL